MSRVGSPHAGLAALASLACALAAAPPARSDHGHAATIAEMEAAVREHFAASPEHGRTPAARAGAPADTIRATSNRFDADGSTGTETDTVTVFEGESVLWTWVAGVHTVTSGVPGAPDAGALFDVPLGPSDPTFTWTYSTAGTYPFFCSPHSSTMRGAVVVRSLVGVRPLPAATAEPGFLRRPAPNPVRGDVVVRFGLARPGMARLDVLDARGRRVARLVDRRFEAGAYAVRWEGRRNGGGRLPAGVYFLVLEVPGARRSERIVLTD